MPTPVDAVACAEVLEVLGDELAALELEEAEALDAGDWHRARCAVVLLAELETVVAAEARRRPPPRGAPGGLRRPRLHARPARPDRPHRNPRGARRDRARAAGPRARRLTTLGPAPSMTFVPTTIALLAEFIRGAALAYNAEYPEAAEQIAAGRPVLSVVGASRGNGRTTTVTAWWGIEAPDGGFIGAGEEPAYHLTARRRDGRYAPIEDRRRTDRQLAALIAEAEAAGVAVVTVGR